jgi:hypothetical protein
VDGSTGSQVANLGKEGSGIVTQTSLDFDGATYNAERDGERLASLHGRVAAFMSDGRWHTITEVQQACGGSENSCAARIRDLRKEKFGGHIVEKQYVKNGLHEYRLIK